jgi:hypothetical protein
MFERKIKAIAGEKSLPSNKKGMLSASPASGFHKSKTSKIDRGAMVYPSDKLPEMGETRRTQRNKQIKDKNDILTNIDFKKRKAKTQRMEDVSSGSSYDVYQQNTQSVSSQ